MIDSKKLDEGLYLNVFEKSIVANEKREVTKAYLVSKRVFDITASILALIVFAIPMIIIAVLIRLSTGNSPIYKQLRAGKNYKDFYVYKFRSMKDSDKSIEEILTKKQFKKYCKNNYKLDNDPRVTKIGKFLRRTSLDELPQLINIIKGQMSVVGPRAIPLRDAEQYGANRTQLQSVTPGLTGYWQVNGRSSTSFNEKIKMDIYYIENRSAWLDLKILLKTVVVVIFMVGAK